MIPLNYVPVPYPKAKYHLSLGMTIVKNAIEEAALGPGWKNSPADFDRPVPSESITAEQAAELYATSAAKVAVTVAEAPAEKLRQVRAAEVENPKYPGGRKQVLAAIDARLAALEAPAP